MDEGRVFRVAEGVGKMDPGPSPCVPQVNKVQARLLLTLYEPNSALTGTVALNTILSQNDKDNDGLLTELEFRGALQRYDLVPHGLHPSPASSLGLHPSPAPSLGPIPSPAPSLSLIPSPAPSPGRGGGRLRSAIFRNFPAIFEFCCP